MSERHVVFGTGPIGMAVIDELVARSKTVRAINRSGGGQFPQGVEVVAGDARDVAFARQAAEGASVVYNTLNPPYSQWPELFPPLQAGVIAGAEAAGAKLVSMENVYMYGDVDGQPMTEDMPYAAHTKKGKVRAAMSRDLMEAHEKGRVQAVIARASDYFGPRATWQAVFGDRVMYPALQGKAAQVIGNPDMPHTFSYVPDIGRALVTLGESDETAGEIWHVPNPPTRTVREILTMIYTEAGHPLKMQVAPKLLLWLLGRFDADLREVPEMLYQFEKPFTIDHSKYQKAFGDHATPLEDAIRETVQWYREHPKQ